MRTKPKNMIIVPSMIGTIELCVTIICHILMMYVLINHLIYVYLRLVYINLYYLCMAGTLELVVGTV